MISKMWIISLFWLFQTILAIDYSDDVYNTLFKLTYYPKISYCSYEPTFHPGPLEDACPKIEFCEKSSSTEIEEVVRPDVLDKEISGTSYIAIDHSKRKVYVVFRGTLSPGDALTDITFLQCPYVPVLANGVKYEMFSNVSKPEDVVETLNSKTNDFEKFDCEDCMVHCGLYVEFTKFIGEVFETAQPFLDKGYELVVTGHSLGGGYALLGGLEFLTKGYDPLLVTYASLRVGDPVFNEWVDKKFHTDENVEILANGGDLPIPSFSRVYQETDIVPRLPPVLPGIAKYTHSGMEFAITKVRLPHEKENVLFKGASNNYANDGIDFKFQPGILLPYYQHTHEFQRISWPCDDSDTPFP